MKKNYFMLAAATMMLAACAETDVVNEIAVEETPQAIGFETFANKQTRADDAPTAEATNLQTHHGAFSVWASKKLTETNFVDVYGGKTEVGTVSYDENATTETKWEASPVKFWDKAALNYYFYAAAPTDAGWTLTSQEGVTTDKNTVGTDGIFSLSNFTLTGTNLATASANMVGTWIGKTGDKDLMVATPVSLANEKYKGSEPEPVLFIFRHILSKLNIKVKGSDLSAYDATIKLNALDVVNLNSKANYTESTNECDWSGWNTPYTLKGGWTGTSLELATAYVYTHEYLVIPQTVSYIAWMNQGTIPSVPYLYIDYNVETTGNGSSVSTENFKSYYSLADIFGDHNLVFAEGGQYTLSVSIAPDVIEFDTEEKPWVENNPKNENSTPDIDVQ